MVDIYGPPYGDKIVTPPGVILTFYIWSTVKSGKNEDFPHSALSQRATLGSTEAEKSGNS